MKEIYNIHKSITLRFEHRLMFTENLFDVQNPLLRELLEPLAKDGGVKALVVLDSGVAEKHPYLADEVRMYAKQYPGVISFKDLLIVPGGESVKNSLRSVFEILQRVERHKICRHSVLIAIGGGAVLDMAGLAAATAHRGIRLIRVPTTVLSQNDSGVGVKNGINFFGKKNFLGTFALPYAVINDGSLLSTLDDRDWISGIAEAVKVALIKDADFYFFLRDHAEALRERNAEAMHELIYRCAALHLDHIAGADPFETGSSRPLDFGHWSAHKMEQLTGFSLRHGEAVAIGMALDTTYSWLKGYLKEGEWLDIINTLELSGFDLSIPREVVFEDLMIGLQEFREHLGGVLTISLLKGIGEMIEVHQIDKALMQKAFQIMTERSYKKIRNIC